jgi:hypothetical protein
MPSGLGMLRRATETVAEHPDLWLSLRAAQMHPDSGLFYFFTITFESQHWFGLVWFYSFWIHLQDRLTAQSRPRNCDRLLTHCYKKSTIDRFEIPTF